MTKETDDLRLLSIDKRLVDAELTLNEISSKLKSFDATVFSEIKQRQDDLEDLVLVDNAGVIELKKMLEGTSQQQAPDELKAKVEQLGSEIETLKQSKPEAIAAPSEDLKKYVDDKLSAINVQQPVTGNEDVKNELMLTKSRISALEKSITEPKEQLTKPVLDELQSIHEELLTVKSKVASTEKFAQEINTRVDDIEPSLSHVETMTSFGTTLKDAESKMKTMADMMSRMDALKSEIQEKASRVSSLYQLIQSNSKNIVALQNEVKNLHAGTGSAVSTQQLKDAVTQMNQQMNDMSRRLEGNRLFLMDMFKDDINKAITQLDQGRIYANINKMIETKLARFGAAYDDKIKQAVKTMEDDIGPSIMDEQMIELVNRTLYLETRLSTLEKTIKDFRQTTMPIIIE